MISSAIFSRAIPVLLLTGSLVGGGWYLHHLGYTDGHDDATRDGKADLDALKIEHTQAMATQEREARERIETLTSRLQTNQHAINEMASQLAEQQRRHRNTTDRLTGEIHRVTTLYRRSLEAEPEPAPQCVFTRGWVRLYDSATGAYPDTVPVAGHPIGAVAPAPLTDPAWQLDSGRNQAELLEHHIRYAEQCSNIAVQLSSLIHAVQQQRR